MSATAAPDLITGIETFAAGDYPGDQPGEVWSYTPEDVRTIARNFAALSEGDNPAHSVEVVLTHDGVQTHGKVAAARVKGDLLLTDWQDVSVPLQAMRNAKRIRKVSAEIKRDFTDRKGNVTPGPYLYRVAVLGADPPRVKGLRDIPARFADKKRGRRITRTFRFADKGTPMDFTAALAFLAGKGIDVSAYGDQTPPEMQAVLISVATAWQQEETDEGAATTGDAATMGDPAGNPKKVTVTQQFADRVDKSLRRTLATFDAKLEAGLKRINDAEAAAVKARQSREAEERVSQVRLFCDRMKNENRIDPADAKEDHPNTLQSIMVALARQPQPETRKFADGKTEKTPLQLLHERTEMQPVRKFSERLPQGQQQKPDDPFEKRLAAKTAAEAERAKAIAGRN